MLSEKIAERRQALGLTRIELAQRSGCAVNHLYALEHGVQTDCNLSTARRIARALGCGIDYLAETFDPTVDPLPDSSKLPPRRPRGRPRKRPLAEAASR